MKMQSVEDLMYVGLTYALDFEERIGANARKMAEASTDVELIEAFEKTETQSKKYAERIEGVFEKIGKKKDTAKNHIALAMIDEVENMISNTDPSMVRDAALIVAVNQQQMYRVATYGSLKSYAELIGKGSAVSDLALNLEESKKGDEKFTTIGETRVNRSAAAVPVAA